MNILLFGKHGQLGWELQRSLACLGNITAYDYPEIDFAKPETLRPLIRSAAPEIIVNAIAYTNVDKAESEPELVRLVNAASVGVMAEEALRQKTLLVHYSTDYVFDGRKSSPYTEEDTPNPINIYGQSKLEGEQAIQQVGGYYLILRTGWMYSLRRDNFLLKVLEWARHRRIVQIANDQYGNPTSSRLLAELTAQTLVYGKSQIERLRKHKNIFHVAGFGHTSRFEWAQTILNYDTKKEEWVMEKLEGISADNFSAPAQRPANCALACRSFEQVFSLSLPAWSQGVEFALKEYCGF
jgi:dTDP-4-dehydrorhamnose reductase